MIRVSGVTWYTNMEIKKRHEELILYRHYTPEEYPTYENYDAIDVSKTTEIPVDYFGNMGVPVTFLDKYNPEQFEIIGNAGDSDWLKEIGVPPMGAEAVKNLREQGNKSHVSPNTMSLYLRINGKVGRPYSRIIIRRKK